MKRINKSAVPAFILNNLGYKLGRHEFLFRAISMSLPHGKIGLVGANGAGKSTLVRLLVEELEPSEGSIERHAKVAYLPQDYRLDLSQDVAEALGVKEKLEALAKVATEGSTPDLKKIIDNEWDLTERVKKALDHVGLATTELETPLEKLSGGQRTKVKIASLLVTNPDYLILDEPTNNLDSAGVKVIEDIVKSWDKGLLIVSHRRGILEHVNYMYDLREGELHAYGGNYTFYREARDHEEELLRKDLSRARESLEHAERKKEVVMNRQEKRNERGKAFAASGSIPRMSAGKRKQRAQKTHSKLYKFHTDRVEQRGDEYQEAKEAVFVHKPIKVDLSATTVPSGKLMLEMEKVSFSYPEKQGVLTDFDLEIHGPERVALSGPNGAGKTTLTKLMIGELEPSSGEIRRGTEEMRYLDQHIKLFDNEKNLLENFMRIWENDAKQLAADWLSHWHFSGKEMMRYPDELSGGERMRAALAYVLAGDNPPQLLVLDEPTNNLDLETTHQIEDALKSYRGTLVVISHDEVFLENIGVSRTIALPL